MFTSVLRASEAWSPNVIRKIYVDLIYKRFLCVQKALRDFRKNFARLKDNVASKET